MSLEELKGNEGIKTRLRHALETGRIGHAYILEGVRGSGRMTAAKAFAAGILQTEHPEKHPDFTVVTNQLYDPSKKQENVLVDTIRNMKRDIYIRPYAGERKVYVVPRADTMQAPAQNSLLKVFEEPPEYCTILLLAENANAFLPTILSRAQILRLQPAGRQLTEEYLKKQKGMDPVRAEQLAVISGGVIGKALQLSQDDRVIGLREETLQKMTALADGSAQTLYAFVRFLKQHKAEADFILEVLLSFGRDVAHKKLCGNRAEIVNADQSSAIDTFSGKISRRAAARFCEITMLYRSMISQNVNYPAAVHCMALEYWEEIHGRNHRC